MSISYTDICIRLRILNPQRQPFEGTVDLEFKRRNGGPGISVKSADASKDIDVRGLQRAPHGLYQVTVTPTDVFKPVTQFVNIPANGFNILEIVIDNGADGKPLSPVRAAGFKVFGTVRDKYQRPMECVTVKAYDKDIRRDQPLGQPTVTDATGAYQIDYSKGDFARTDLLAADVIVRVLGREGKLLKETSVFYNAPQQLRVDIDLSDRAYAGPSEFEQTVSTIKPFIGDLLPAELTEDQKTQDITFLVNKTGLVRGRVEAFVMAYRFEKDTKTGAAVYYGLIQHGPANAPLTQPTMGSAATSFDSKASFTFAGLMRQDIDSLMTALQGAIDANTVPYSLSANLDAIKKQLIDDQQRYLESNPAPTSPSNLTLKLEIAGLQGDQVAAFKSLFTDGSGTPQEFWAELAKNPEFQAQKVSLLQAVFTLSQLTGEQMVLTDQLIKAQKIQTPADLPKLAANTSQDWLTILRGKKIAPPPGTPGETATEQLQNYAAELEQNLTKAFPTPAFSARIRTDKKSRIPNAGAISGFLDANADFDLLTTRIGAYLEKQKPAKGNRAAAAKGKRAAAAPAGAADPDFANQLKKTQRIFKLAPTYASANALLGDNIDSAHKIYRMGQNNFVAKYGPSLGSADALRTYQKATQAHALALALAGNLKSLSDASHLNVFPDYTETIMDAMVKEVPDLDTLFGHEDFCACEECRSVYGAAAYLTDILHYLENRTTSINIAPLKNASVAEALLRRRPDLADIDLNCDNTNIAFPYIDIANEIMEDFIVAPVVTVGISFLAKLVEGPIDAGLCTAIVAAFQAAGQDNVASLLTTSAAVSDKYSMERLKADDTSVTEDHWIIRDEFVVLKATNQTANIAVQLVHQTLLSQDAVNANPEYVNIPAYNVLKADVRPFTLPFDLFETEGEIYLSKLGTTKADLIDAFRPEHQPAVAPSAATQSDLDMAYAYLNVNQGERTLIFQADLANQNLYWGPLAGGTTVELDLFMNATGLSYEQVLDLLGLKTINPTQDSVIVSDDLSCDTNKKHVNNLAPTKFDNIHRFLRLWRKTTFTLQEMDAVVQAAALGNNTITPDLAWKLQYFLQQQKLWSLSAFQYLAFFGDIDTTGTDNLYNSLFQNRAITNPLNPDFAISVVSSTAPLPPAITNVHKGILIGALGLAPGDLDTLIKKTPDGLLSLDNISYFYRMAQLSQALSISIDDLLVFLDLIKISPFTDPPTTGAFYSKWRTVISSQFSADDLNYVLRHQNDAAGSLIASDDLVAAALADLQGKILQVQAATTVVPDPKGQLLKKWLTDPLLKWNAALLAKLMDILSTQDDTEFQQKLLNNQNFLLNLRVQYHDTVLAADLPSLAGVVFPDSLVSQISYDAANRKLQLIGVLSAGDWAVLNGLSVNGPYLAALAQLFNASQQTSNAAANIFFATVADINANLRVLLSAQLPARYQLFLTTISLVYNTVLQQNAVQNELCGWFKINKDVASAIEASQTGIYTDFTNAAFVGKAQPLTTANYPNQFNWYQKIAKVCFVGSKLKLTADALAWFMKYFGNIHSLDFWNLPIVPVAGPVTTFPSFEVLVNVLKFDQYFPAVSQVTAAATNDISVYSVLEDVINAAPLATTEADLMSLTGWEVVQLDQLINAPTNYLNLTLAAPSDLQDIRVLLRLRQCFGIMSNVGANAADCVAWIGPSLSYDDAVRIKQALKKRYPEDQWVGVTQPLQNTLRQAKRDALVAHLLANPPAGQSWLTSDDLYDYFLIDVEMMACQPTSRIVQATNSVQMFVQRCFLNLEDQITVDLNVDADWSQWQWMKYFRLWQANRKVFLYPENWIEPELLPGEIKSPFFKELENDLLQNDVTQDNVETAFLSYLDKLDGVARLEIKAMWYEDAKQTLHVVGRTYGGDPKTYYYRTFEQSRRWTPWVKIDQDIASDHIVLTVFNHRVYLFWAVFSEKSFEVTTVTVPALPGSTPGQQTIDKPPKYWQIQMAFTEYKNGKWTPKKVSNADPTGALSVPPSPAFPPDAIPAKDDFIFTPLDIPDLDFLKNLLNGGTPKDPNTFLGDLLKGIGGSLESNGDLQINCFLQTEPGSYYYKGTFDLDPCKGYPVVSDDYETLVTTLFDRSGLYNMLDVETNDTSSDALAVKTVPFLKETPGRFANLVPLQMGFLDRLLNIIYQIIYGVYYQPKAFATREGRPPVTVGTFMPYFYQDQSRTYFVQTEVSDNADFEFTYQDLEELILALLEGDPSKANGLPPFPKGKALYLLVHFYNHYHPLVCPFIRILFDQGIDALMSRSTQLLGDFVWDPDPNKFDFGQTYEPTGLVYSGQPETYNGPSGPVTDPDPGYPKGNVDFGPKGGYSLYNWELFFHAPLMIAQRLSQNLQFEDADHWLKYIFNPTDGSAYPSPDKYWNTKPFFLQDQYTTQDINYIMSGINSKDSTLVTDVTDWRNNPFQPHYIAQYRTVAYQKTAVMKYLDHLIAWGDNLFQQDTMETVMEAEQLYVLAKQILGPRPLVIPPSFETPVDNFGQLDKKLDAFSNAMVDIENLLPLQQITGFVSGGLQGLPRLETLYFCIPPNDKLMGYWDTVEGRLFNIRHCLNLQGKFAPPALFAPAIDPGLLVRAAAAGLDIGSILTDLNSPLPNYRFSVMVQKTLEMCSEVKSLGSALLQAMEKKDAEDMSLLRSKNGIAVQKAVLIVKQQQVEEATHNLEALQQQQALVQTRIDYYQGLVSGGLNSWETTSLGLSQAAIGGENSAVAIEYLGNVLGLIPDFDVGAEGFGGSPRASVKFGGTQLGGATRAIAAAIRGTAGVMHSQANVASTQATFQRRLVEWQFQVSVANAELQQVSKQILAATVRQTIANQEVDNQNLQIDNAQAEDDFMHSKFTNSDLYAYMIGQISATYFQSYQLAYAMAKQTEQTFRYELGLADSSYINFGYWNSLKKGLLAGEQLAFDVRSMEKAYRDQNVREYELTKHICLSQLDASALQLLKTTRECWINLPEELFDMDYPGHYLRRVKTVGITIPCVLGPYTTIGCTLTMTRNSVRVNNTSGVAYPRKVVNGIPADDPRFRDAVGSIQSIATSTAQNDDGLFELSFRDERYLPFEGAGAISQWHLKISSGVAALDLSTISEVILHLKYTARDGGDGLRSDAATSLQTRINSMLVSLKDTGLARMFSAKHEFPTEWYAFLNPAAGADQVLTLNLTRDRFPYFASVAPSLKLKQIELVADTSLAAINKITVAPAPPAPPTLNFTKDGIYGNMLRLILDYSASKKDSGAWTITNPSANPPLTGAQINDLIVIAHYEVSLV
jgi:Tc toxin complex TcA C-terminal TcB-binding domain/Neuraminidase-like domain/Salmonella virulence plasmid 28.1kDa A protein